LQRPKILIADDDRSVRAALTRRLHAWGYRVLQACDGLGVIAQASREGVAAMILDHGMPNGAGRDVAYMLRRECEAPIIFLSGYDRESFQPISLTLSEVYYLPKPLDAFQLRTLLVSLLSPLGTERACA